MRTQDKSSGVANDRHTERKDREVIRDCANEIKKNIRERRHVKALDLAEAMCRDWPNANVSWIMLFRVHLAMGDLVKAEDALSHAVLLETAVDSGQAILNARFSLSRAKADDRALLENALALASIPDALPAHKALLAAEASARLGGSDAYEQLVAHLGTERRSRRGARAAYEHWLAANRENPLPLLLESFVLGEDAVPENVHAVQLHATMFGHNQSLFDDLLDRAAARWPDDPSVAEVAPRYRAVDTSDLTSHSGGTPDEVRTWIMSRKWRANDGEAVLSAFDRDLANRPPRRSLAVATPDQEVIQSPVMEGAPTAIVFPGFGDMQGGTLMHFDAYLAMAGYNAIYLRDQSRRLGGCGIASLGGDVQSTAKTLLEMLRRRTATLVIGNSAGGLAALNYAPLLGAARVLAFSPPTNITPEFLEAIGDRRIRSIHDRLFRDLSADYRRAIPFIEATDPRPKADIYFDLASHEDAAHAQALAGHPFVQLRPVPAGGKHGIWTHMIIHGTFFDAIGVDQPV
jgi:tetratricopeptide (TPR) repeat protein